MPEEIDLDDDDRDILDEVWAERRAARKAEQAAPPPQAEGDDGRAPTS